MVEMMMARGVLGVGIRLLLLAVLGRWVLLVMIVLVMMVVVKRPQKISKLPEVRE